MSAELYLEDAAAYFEDFNQVQPWGSLIWVIYSFSVLLWPLLYNCLNTQAIFGAVVFSLFLAAPFVRMTQKWLLICSSVVLMLSIFGVGLLPLSGGGSLLW